LAGEYSKNATPMAKSTSTVLIVILLILTFPIWIGLAGGIFGLVMGLFGAAIGLIAGIFGAIGGILGAIFGVIGEFFSWIFGGIFDCDFYSPHVSFPRPITLLLIILVAVLIMRSRNQPAK